MALSQNYSSFSKLKLQSSNFRLIRIKLFEIQLNYLIFFDSNQDHDTMDQICVKMRSRNLLQAYDRNLRKNREIKRFYNGS